MGIYDFLGKIEFGLRILFWLKIFDITRETLGKNGSRSEAIFKISLTYKWSLVFNSPSSSCHGLSSSIFRSKSAMCFHMHFIASSGLYCSMYLATSGENPLVGVLVLLKSDVSHNFAIRATKLPTPLARSELYFSLNFSGIISQSLPKENDEMSKYLVASDPYSFTKSTGSIIFPSVFDIF